NAYGTNARLGAGDWMVVEADESDGTFLKLPADVAIVTNIDPEHLDHFGTFEAIEAAFESFVTNLPFYGFAVMCIDHPAVQTLVGRIEDRRVVTYGENPQADARLVDLVHADGGRAQGRARVDQGPGDCRDAAAPLHAARRAVRPVLHLLQRCRRGDHRACLCGGRSADPGRRPRHAGRGPARARPPARRDAGR